VALPQVSHPLEAAVFTVEIWVFGLDCCWVFLEQQDIGYCCLVYKEYGEYTLRHKVCVSCGVGSRPSFIPATGDKASRLECPDWESRCTARIST
jgi:hypothetical protein